MINMKRLCCLFVIVLSVTTIESTASDRKIPLEINRVGLDKKSFDPSKGEMVNVGFELSEQAKAEVLIYDWAGRKVRSLSVSGTAEQRYSIAWDGRTDEDELASGNIFLYVIKAKTDNGDEVVFNRATVTGGLEVKSLEYTLDRKTGMLEYVLPKACMIRIRVGLKDGMFGGALFDWQPQTAGRHSYKWDGKDGSGVIRLLGHKDLDLRLTCYTLPDNVIITTGSVASWGQDESGLQVMEEEREYLWATKDKYLHYAHDPRICHQPKFEVSFPTAVSTVDGDVLLASKAVPVRVRLDPCDAQHLINTRFEVMIFVDGVFIHEVEEGTTPFTFNWDASGFIDGFHVVTVNLIAYDDHIGSVSHRVLLRKGG